MTTRKVFYVKIPINFTESDLELIEAACTRTHLSKAEIVRLCVRHYAENIV